MAPRAACSGLQDYTHNGGELDLKGSFADFEHFAAKFKAETGRPAALVLNDVHILAEKHPTRPFCLCFRIAQQRPSIWISTRWPL